MKNVELKPWKVTQSKDLVSDKWLNLKVETCVSPNGKKIDPYYILNYPDWVNMVCLNEKQQILLSRQYRHGLKKILRETN